MTPETLFTIASAAPMPIWAIWMLAPRSRAAAYLRNALWPWALLALLYVGVLITALSGGTGEGSFSSLAGIMALFARPWGALAAWVHFLAFDLFVARWIVRDAERQSYWLTPILLLTLMAGPAGLLLYLALRPRFRRQTDDAKHRDGLPIPAESEA